jgi:hypothetical protein
MSVAIPKRIAEELEKSDVDVGSLIVDLLVKFLNLDPHVAAESHLELALKYLEEGKRLIDEDPLRPARSSTRQRRRPSRRSRCTST